MDNEKCSDLEITVKLTYSEIMAIVGAVNLRASRLADMADMTDSKQKAAAMRSDSAGLSLLAVKLMQFSALPNNKSGLKSLE